MGIIVYVLFFTEKARRLKDAKEEAQEEIDSYKKERETLFNNTQQKVRT